MSLIYNIKNSFMIVLQVIELSRLIGKTIPESIRRMMQHLFTDKWLKNYSYIGFKGKNKFSSLLSCKIIFGKIYVYILYI